MNLVHLKPLSVNELELLRKWRNSNRKFFITNKIVTPEMQRQWYKSYKLKPNDTVYIVYYQSRPVGTISVIVHEKEIEIGRVMLGDKKFARQGYIGQALEIIIAQFPGKVFYLELLKNNLAAFKFYQKHRFVLKKISDNNLYMERDN